MRVSGGCTAKSTHGCESWVAREVRVERGEEAVFIVLLSKNVVKVSSDPRRLVGEFLV